MLRFGDGRRFGHVVRSWAIESHHSLQLLNVLRFRGRIFTARPLASNHPIEHIENDLVHHADGFPLVRRACVRQMAREVVPPLQLIRSLKFLAAVRAGFLSNRFSAVSGHCLAIIIARLVNGGLPLTQGALL